MSLYFEGFDATNANDVIVLPKPISSAKIPPFVFNLIQDQMNASISKDAIEEASIETKKLMQKIEAVTKYTLPKKMYYLIARLLNKFKPVNTCVITSVSDSMDISKAVPVDFVFLEADLSTDKILQMADLLLQSMHSDGWMMTNGIHKSSEMEAVWEKLKKHPKVRLTIDLFFIGLLFCRKEQKELEHFIIRY